MKIFKKEKKVVHLVTEHLESVRQCVETVAEAVEKYLGGDLAGADEQARRVGKLESEADAHRRGIHATLFSGAYLPLIREDIHHLVDRVDRIANAAEDCSAFFVGQRPDVPEEMRAPFIELVQASCATTKPLGKAMAVYFKPKGKMDEVREHAKRVIAQESLVDEKEWALTRQIFGSSLELSQKLHLKLALDHVVEIADRTEDAADRLELAGLKSVL